MTTDGIVFRCSKCESMLKAKESMAGQQAKCPRCGEELRVPTGTDGTDGTDG